jgi:DNA polymerase III epsilon subunit-like protein
MIEDVCCLLFLIWLLWYFFIGLHSRSFFIGLHSRSYAPEELTTGTLVGLSPRGSKFEEEGYALPKYELGAATPTTLQPLGPAKPTGPQPLGPARTMADERHQRSEEPYVRVRPTNSLFGSVGIPYRSWPSGTELVLVDFETTGLNPGFGDRVVEYAYAVIGEDGSVSEQSQRLVNPGRRMSADATWVNGITDEMLEGEPSFEEVGMDLLNALEDRIMVAHNAAKFDLPCLYTECREAGWQLPNFQVIDSLKLTRAVWKDAPNHQLTTLAGLVGHQGGIAHRAMADVESLHSVLKGFFNKFPSSFPTTADVLSTAGVSVPTSASSSTTNFTKTARVLQQAIDDGQAVRVRYYSQSSGTTDRTITPEVVYIHSNGYEYFDGYCHKDGRTKSFKVDSIRRFF